MLQCGQIDSNIFHVLRLRFIPQGIHHQSYHALMVHAVVGHKGDLSDDRRLNCEYVICIFGRGSVLDC